ncbi:MAG: IclR family transcriptional regulator [bacterium]|nr:IclR family transcriptional regulator [bacterium]
MQDKAITHSGTPAPATSVEKAIDILFCFDSEHTQLRLTDVSERVGLHKSTAHRLLALLRKKGLIVSDPDSQLYSLGPGVVELSWVVLRQQNLRAVCHPYLERIRQDTNETVSLYTRMGDKRLCVEELESGQDIKYSHTVGLTAPLHVGAPGKALLAFLPETELQALLSGLALTAITPNTLTDAEQLREELHTTRKRGYAVSRGERSSGASAVAAPIRDWSGKTVATLGVLGPSQRLTHGVLKAMGKQVMQVAQEISFTLGYRPQTVSDDTTL